MSDYTIKFEMTVYAEIDYSADSIAEARENFQDAIDCGDIPVDMSDRHTDAGSIEISLVQ